MHLSMILFLISSAGFASLVISVALLVLSKEGRMVLNAKLMKRQLIFKIDPDSRRVKLDMIPNKEFVEKRGDSYFLGGWPCYTWNGVKVFFALHDEIVDYDPKIIEEIQKVYGAGVENYEKLREAVIDFEEQEIRVKTEDGKEEIRKMKVPVFKGLVGRAHRVLNIKPYRDKNGFKVHIEEYTPIDFVALANFYNRKLSATIVKKILKLKDMECYEKVQKVYTKLLSKLKIDKKVGLGFNPVYLIYIGIFLFILLMGWSMYGSKIIGGGGTVVPPKP